MPDERNLYQDALMLWGEDAQILMLFEEMSELQKELCKYLRRGRTADIEEQRRIIEEIVDVDIMIGQMKEIFVPDFDTTHMTKLLDLKRRVKESARERLLHE